MSNELYLTLLVPALFAMELIYFKIADRFNIVDKPNARSSHTILTRRGGGIIFVLSAILWAATHGFAFPWFLGGILLIAGISFVDDLISVSNKIRLLCHFVAFAMMFHEWALFTTFPWWISVIALVFCVGIINAYNFMDGINGITGAYSLAGLGALAWVNFRTPFTENSLLWTMIASVLVFCFFNFRTRAKCFAGDVGSVAIAFAILFFLGQLMIETGDISWIILLLVYGVDSVLTIIHRIMLRENIGEAHRKHLYQILSNELQVPHVLVSTGYFVAQAVISSGFILIAPAGASARWIYFIIAGSLLTLLYVFFMKKYFHLHQSK